jgi:hypothetical protein
MKYFYDCEFIDDGKTIDLISIGIVCEDGREYYRQSSEFDNSQASAWVEENVINHLVQCEDGSLFYHAITLFLERKICKRIKLACPWRTRKQIKQEILTFMDSEKYGKPELWGYYSAYDHVAFCQLFGTMMDLPKGFPMYTKDIQQLLEEQGITDDMLPKQEGQLHNALEDAKYNYIIWKFITTQTEVNSAFY